VTPGHALLGFTVAVSTSSIATTVAQTVSDAGPIPAYTSAGATATAVAALVYVARQMVAGNLVAKDSAKTEAKLAEALATVTQLLEEAHKREERLFNYVSGNGKEHQ
jgi:hypothetical protein